MANSDNAFGLRPFKKMDGSAWTGAGNEYFITTSITTASYVGGLVKLAGDATADGVPTVDSEVSAGDVMVGVILGFDGTQDSATSRAADTERVVWVCDDPTVLFEVQEDGLVTPIAAASIGRNAALVNFTSGSTSTGRSAIEIDSDSVESTATLDVQIRRLSRRPDNTLGDANAKFLVQLNNHQFVDGTVGV